MFLVRLGCRVKSQRFLPRYQFWYQEANAAVVLNTTDWDYSTHAGSGWGHLSASPQRSGVLNNSCRTMKQHLKWDDSGEEKARRLEIMSARASFAPSRHHPADEQTNFFPLLKPLSLITTTGVMRLLCIQDAQILLRATPFIQKAPKRNISTKCVAF